jgi:hypothetical protein
MDTLGDEPKVGQIWHIRPEHFDQRFDIELFILKEVEKNLFFVRAKTNRGVRQEGYINKDELCYYYEYMPQ